MSAYAITPVINDYTEYCIVQSTDTVALVVGVNELMDRSPVHNTEWVPSGGPFCTGVDPVAPTFYQAMVRQRR